MSHPNEGLFRRMLTAFASGDMDAVGETMTEDITYHIPGRNLIAGDYKGKQEVYGILRKVQELTDGTFRLMEHDVLANEDHIVAMHVARARRNDRSTEYNATVVYHVRDGKISAAWVHPEDQHAYDDFWE